MHLVKLGVDKYINVDRMTYVEARRKGVLVVHFDVGGGDVGGPVCCTKLDGEEAQRFARWLDANSNDASA